MEESEGSLMTSILEAILQESRHVEARQDAITVLTSLTYVSSNRGYRKVQG